MPRKSDARTSNEIIETIVNKIVVAKTFDDDSDISMFSIKEMSNAIDEVINIKQELGKLQKRIQRDLKEKIEKGDNQNETVKNVRLSNKSAIRIVKKF